MNTNVIHSEVTQLLTVANTLQATALVILCSYFATYMLVCLSFLGGGAFQRTNSRPFKTSLYAILAQSYLYWINWGGFLTNYFSFSVESNFPPTKTFPFLLKRYILLTRRYIFLLESYILLLAKNILLLGTYLVQLTRCLLIAKPDSALSKRYILPTKTVPYTSKTHIFISESNSFLLGTYLFLLHNNIFLTACYRVLKMDKNIILYIIPNPLTQPYNYQSKITIVKIY